MHSPNRMDGRRTFRRLPTQPFVVNDVLAPDNAWPIARCRAEAKSSDFFTALARALLAGLAVVDSDRTRTVGWR